MTQLGKSMTSFLFLLKKKMVSERPESLSPELIKYKFF